MVNWDIWIVYYLLEGAVEPVLIAFDNREAAELMYSSIEYKYKWFDKLELYSKCIVLNDWGTCMTNRQKMDLLDNIKFEYVMHWIYFENLGKRNGCMPILFDILKWLDDSVDFEFWNEVDNLRCSEIESLLEKFKSWQIHINII